jgi:hypothetical protein
MAAPLPIPDLAAAAAALDVSYLAGQQPGAVDANQVVAYGPRWPLK